MKIGPFISLLALALLGQPAMAQFYDADVDPGGIRWSVRRSANYRLYYPSVADSLAQKYLISLEQVRPAVGASIGVMPNEYYRRPMTALLHPYTPVANGSVAWAPRRLDLYSVQDAYAPDPFPWIEQLTIHESRHIAQMQLGRARKYRPIYWLSGQMFSGALAGLYGGAVLLEGDAVTAETALTQSGRGRTADFLEYMRVAFDEGDFRDWYRWRYGSLNLYSPDHYKIGYMTVAGMRSLYDDPLFTARFYGNITGSRGPLPWNILHKTMRQGSGKKFKETFREIEEHFRDDWADDIEARGPFMPLERVTAEPKYYEAYTSPVPAGGRMLVLRSGITHSRELVELAPDGSSRRLMYFSNNTSRLRWSEENARLYWSETIPDERWGLDGTSRICWLDPVTGAHGYLTREGRLFNPAPLTDGTIAVVDYPVSGGSLVKILDEQGQTVREYLAPDGLQVTEVAQLDDVLIAAAVDGDGFSLYRVSDWSELLPKRFVKINQLFNHAGEVLFVSDRTGVNELYSLTGNGVRQLTCTRHGASDAAVYDGYLYWAAPGVKDRALVRTRLEDLPTKEIVWGDVHRYAIADKLSAQEAGLKPLAESDTRIGGERPYRRLLNPLSVHSWAPAFVDYDSYSGIGEIDVEEQLGLGMTAFFQNRIGTLAGSAGLQLTSSESNERLRTSAHMDAVYSGLYPVIEADVTVGERDAYTYRCFVTDDNFGVYAYRMGGPAVNASLDVYIPFNLKHGAWYRGVVPRVNLYLSNDVFNSDVLFRSSHYDGDIGSSSYIITGEEDGRSVYYSSAAVSLKAYSILGTGQSCLYPKWGAGTELGLSWRSGLDNIYSRGFYVRLYGYLPGAAPTHGIKLGSLLQLMESSDVHSPRNIVTTAPRGLSSVNAVNAWLNALYRTQAKFSVDYAMPLLPVDFHIGQLAYIRNFELCPFADLALAGGRSRSGSLYSVGASVGVRLGNFAWLAGDIRAGVNIAYNGGSIYRDLHTAGLLDKTLSAETYFTIDL